MLQLRRIRSFKKSNGDQEYDTNFDPDILPANHTELFKNLDTYIQQIPEFERYNCHYTQGDSPGGKKRGKGSFLRQDIIPFDIDGIEFVEDREENKSRLNKFRELFFEVTGFDPQKTAVVFSGNGLHFIVLTEPWTDKNYFKKYSRHYQTLCQNLEKKFRASGLSFKEMDLGVFAPNKMMRLPGTLNKKPGKKDRMCQLMQSNLEKQEAPWTRITPVKGASKTIKAKNDFSRNVKTDNAAIQNECLFLKYAAENQEKVNEGQWYAALSIWGRLDNGRDLCHQNSKGHPKYNPDECNTKIDQALGPESGPRTCDNIGSLWPGCGDCPYNGKIKSPINIKSKEFIATEHTGFHKTEYDKQGNPKLIPAHDDLRRFFAREKAYRTSEENGAVWIWDEKKYGLFTHNQLRGFAGENFDPQPMEKHVQEFIHLVTRQNHVPQTFFEGLPGHINFDNGVLDIRTKKLLPHSPDQGFLWVLPYSYDPEAVCPEFDKMMKRITVNDKDLEELLLEIVGDAICDRTYFLQKATILVGGGSNGKSFFLDIVKALVGEANFSAVGIKEMDSPGNRHMLKNALVNISDEMPSMKNTDTDTFKKIMGGSMTIRKLYQDPITVRCSTKLIFAANEIPTTYDNSHGMFRRLTIIPFDAQFDKTNIDHGLKDRILKELPGIFNRVLAAFERLMARGHLLHAHRSDAELARYQSENDTYGTLIQDMLEWDASIVKTRENFLSFSDIIAQLLGSNVRMLDKHKVQKQVRLALKRSIPDLDARAGREYDLNTKKRERGYYGIRAIGEKFANGGQSGAVVHGSGNTKSVNSALDLSI